MPTGREDYWYSMIASRQVLGSGQTDWFAMRRGDIVSEAEVTLLSHEVPANYILNLTGVFISCSQPGIQKAQLHIDADLIWDIRFDTNYQLSVSPGGVHVIPEGDLIEVKITNLDDQTVWFSVIMLGFLEHLIS